MLKLSKADYTPTLEELDALDSYCADDVRAETALLDVTPPQSAQQVPVSSWLAVQIPSPQKPQSS